MDRFGLADERNVKEGCFKRFSAEILDEFGSYWGACSEENSIIHGNSLLVQKLLSV